MAWNTLKAKPNWNPKGGLGKALQMSKALTAMGYTSWNHLEPGDYSRDPLISAYYLIAYIAYTYLI